MAVKRWPIENPGDLQKHVGKMVYLVFHDECMVGSTRLAEINEYMASEDILDSYADDPSALTVLYGLVLDVRELPVEIPDGMPEAYNLWAIKHDNYSSMEHELMVDFEAVADYVEWGIEDGASVLDIDDFAIVFARELSGVLTIVSAGEGLTQERKRSLGVA